MEGKIICINASLHRVLLENNEILDTKTRGKLRNERVYPLVGDNVIVDTKTKTIEKVLERKNSLVRPMVANIDKLLIVMSTSIPSFSSYLIDKFLVIAFSNKIEPVIIITKTDLISNEEKKEINKYIEYYKKLGIKTYLNSEIESIKAEFKDCVVALCGQTGAGKSTLLNKIDNNLNLKTGEVSLSLGRGKHTTRLVELISMNGGMIADTPGFSSLEMSIDMRELKYYYPDFDIPCKYRSCIHVKEDGCEIIKEVGNSIPEWRYQNYIKFIEEVEK